MKTYKWTATLNYMIENGDVAGCGTGGGPFNNLTDAIIEADQNHREGPGVPEWDGRGPKSITIEFEQDGYIFYETFRHYGFWSTALLQRALDWFNGVDTCDDWAKYDPDGQKS